MRVCAQKCYVCTQLGYTPLIAASSMGHVEVVHALLAAGADIEATDSKVGSEGHWQGQARGS